MKAYVEAYGCTLNFGEASEVEDMLSSCGHSLVDSPEQCDVAVLVTCVVIETTERAMLKRLRELLYVPSLVVTGCMATACREQAERIAPDALFVAPGDLDSLRRIVGSEAAPAATKVSKGDSISIVPIATGCLGSCAYCITKLARGGLRSRSSEEVVTSVARAAALGTREIQLTAQDTAAYGLDLETDLPALVESICTLPREFRLRVGMMNPKSVLPMAGRVAQMYSQPKVFKFLHLPAQSGSDAVLERMNRGYTVADFRQIVNETRKTAPDVTLSTDIIVGYPGETEEDHRLSLELVSEIQPDIVNVTRFSARPGTKAVCQGPHVVGWRVKERSRELTDLRFEIALARNSRHVGREVRALSTERGKNSSTILRTDEYKQVVVGKQLDLGRFYQVRITGAKPTYLLGEFTYYGIVE